MAKQKLLIDDYKGANRVFYVSTALVILLSLPGYDGHGFLISIMQAFSEWMAGWFPQLDVIAGTRENPVKTRIVLAFVIAMAPVQLGYFLWTMPAKVMQERLSNGELFRKLLQAILVAAACGIFFGVLFYGVLVAPGLQNLGRFARLYMPIIETDYGSGVMLVVVSELTVFCVSAILVFIGFIFFRQGEFNKNEKQQRVV